jgi:hypothetical protein
MAENIEEAAQVVAQLGAMRAPQVRARYPEDLTLDDIQDMLIDAAITIQLVATAVVIGGKQDVS